MKTAKFYVIILFAILVSSCTNPFRPALRDSSSAGVNNREPLELLMNLEKAYQEKNINLFKELLHPQYRFELLQSEYSTIGIDMDGDGIRDSWWGYDEEIELHKNMFKSGSSDGSYPAPDKIDLRLQVPLEELWEKDPAEGREYWVIVPCYFSLSLVFYSSNSSYAANGVARFYLCEENGRWYIRIWRDESLL